MRKKAIVLSQGLDYGETKDYLVIVSEPIEVHTQVYPPNLKYITFWYRKDNVIQDERPGAIYQNSHKEFWLKYTKKWYDMDKPMEFESFIHDLQLICTLESMEA